MKITMMDVYDAIEELEYYLKYGVSHRPPSMSEIEAINICLEAAKEKAQQ